MKFLELYQSNIQSVKRGLTSLWCSEASSDKQKGYADQLKNLIDNEIFSSEDYEPLVQSMEYYESSNSNEENEIFERVDKNLWKRCLPPNKYFPPYKHQVKAWKSLTAPDCRSMVVTTGTGSGKTECFMIPLVNELRQSPDNTHSVKAIFLYPLNALMEDQKDRLQKLLDDGGERRVTFAVYNGNLPDRENGNNDEEIQKEKKKYPNIIATREELHRNGADIILTNPTMLEYMLIRDKDQHLFATSSLRWIVVDEAHTFTGAAATELAMLMRRVLNAFGTNKDQLHFAASSATLGNSKDKEKQEADLRKFISDISGVDSKKVDIVKGNRITYTPAPEEDPELVECKRKLTSTDCDYIKLSELLPQYSTTEERLKKLDEFCDKGLRAKVHFFYRVANNGIRVQLDQWEDQRKGLLKFQSLMPLDPQATPALEVVRCNHCGEYFAVGEYKLSDEKHYFASTESNDDLFDLTSEQTNKLLFGVVPTKDARRDNNQYVAINGNEFRTGVAPSGDWALVVNTNCQCPHCSYPDRSKKGTVATNQDDTDVDIDKNTTRLRISSEFLSRLMAPGMLDCMKPIDPQKGNKEAPHKGQQYISFVDSRQAAAKGTYNQNVEVERDWVYSRVFHELLERNSELKITKQKEELRVQMERAESSEDWEAYGRLSAQKKQLDRQYPNTADKDYLTWYDIYDKVLKKDPACDYLCRQFANQTNNEIEDDGSINEVVKDRYIFAVMLSNLAKYPPFQASAETMGLFQSYYPKLERITELPKEVKDFNQNFPNANIDLTEWKNLLKIYLDRVPRSNESIYLKLDSHLHCDIFNCSERFGLQRPPHRTARKPFVNEKCDYINIPLIPLLLAKVIDPQSDNLRDVIRNNRDIINKVIDALWKDLTETSKLLQYSDKIESKSKRRSLNKEDFTLSDWKPDHDKDTDNILDQQKNKDGLQYRLNVADIAFKLPEKVFYCEIVEKGGVKKHIRPTYTTFCGYAPYPSANNTEKPFEEKTWDKFAYLYGKDGDNNVSVDTIEIWLHEHRKEMFDYGLLGERGCFSNRIMSVLSYPEPFIQAEHTAQVEKKISRKTQELFKDQKLNILACSTTMEMGVDLGNLELVVMASIPPHPANYKQRAGRSGRNDDTRSACITLCSSDAVGHRVLRDPMQTIIKRKVEMPFVDWDSPTIIQRHVNAFLYRQSGVFFRDNNRSSLNWELIDVFSNYSFGTLDNRPDKDYWRLFDNGNEIFPTEKKPLGNTKGSIYEQFALWLENNANPSEVEFLLKDTDYMGEADQFIDKCVIEWGKRHEEIERELSYYGKKYDEAYITASTDTKLINDHKVVLNTRELRTPQGLLWRIKFNSILKRRLIDYLATHRFTPNANMPVDVIEFDVYHTKKELVYRGPILSNPSYPLQEALSQYAPGNMVVKENRVVRVAGVEYYGKDSAHDREVFYTDGCDVVGSESRRQIDSEKRIEWPVSGKKELEVVLVKSFIPDINAQDSRVMDPSPYTSVNAYLVGVEEWQPSSQHHLMSARCNLDAGEAKILYCNDGIGYGYCMCPSCGKMELETIVPRSSNRSLPAEMISQNPKNLPPCHYAIDRVNDNGTPKICIPPKNKYYRNVVIGGLIQTDFCEMRINKQDRTPANITNDKSLLTTLGLAICRAFTEYIGKDRNSVDFIVMGNGTLCVFDTNPGGSGYSNKLSDTHFRNEVLKRAKEMLDTLKDREEILDKYTVRYLNDVDIDIAKKWLEAEQYTWDNIPDNVKKSSYSTAQWSNILDLLKDFKDTHQGGVLFCNDEFGKWNYMSPELSETRRTWEHRVQEIIRDHSTGANKVSLVIPTDDSIPTKIISMLPQNGWVSIYTTSQRMEDGFYPLACINGRLYFTDEKETASMNGDWAKGNVFWVANDKYDFSNKKTVVLSDSASTCVFNLDNEKCNSNELAGIVIEKAKENGLKIDEFFEHCRQSEDTLKISYTDEHLKTVIGMIATMHFVDTILEKAGRTDNFHVKFVNEKYYTSSSTEVYTPWYCIEKWERRNEFLEKIANHWIESKYNKSADRVGDFWENDCKKEKTLPHWRVLTVECGNKKLNIYPHGGIINEWNVDKSANRNRTYTMNENTDSNIPLIRGEHEIMYIVEIVDE